MRICDDWVKPKSKCAHVRKHAGIGCGWVAESWRSEKIGLLTSLTKQTSYKEGAWQGCSVFKNEEITPLLLWQCNPTFPHCQRLSGAHSERRMAVKLAVSEMRPLLSCSPFNLLITQGSHNAMAVSRFPSSQFRCRHFRAFLSVISEIVKSVKNHWRKLFRRAD